MNEFLIFFLIASTFAFNALCMSPPLFALIPPRPPANVQFGECFAVPEITCGTLTKEDYNYRHICSKKFPANGPQPSRDEKVWYAVGSLGVAKPQSSDEDKYDYIEIEQSQIKFTFLKEVIVEFVARPDSEFRVKFQSLQQSQAFYRMIYADVSMSQAAKNKIGVLHAITRAGNVQMGNYVQAFYEDINGTSYLTFKNGKGDPLLIFSKDEALINHIQPSDNDTMQLLLRVHMMHYILTFSSNSGAKDFSNALSQYVKELNVDEVFPNVKSLFENNRIRI